MISMLSVLNSILAWIEDFWYNRQRVIDEVELNERPVFILGHPRTGTTLLHSLLALDVEQFAICTTFCAGFPSCFLWLEDVGKSLFKGVIDDTRPMDNMPLHFDLPQEDELAINALTAGDGVSPYMPIWFPRLEATTYRPYYAFDDKAKNKDEELPADEMAFARKRWTDAFLFLLKKLTLRAHVRQPKSQNRLLLKSPVHTARIPLLKQLFPKAQFIYIHRHPYQVFRSAAHMADTTYWYTYFQTPTNAQIQEFILRQYEILWDRYQEGKATLPTSDIVEVSYEELTKDPIQALERIYATLGWGEELPAAFRQRLQDDLKGRASYQRNEHIELPTLLQEILHQRWGPSFEVLGYSKKKD